MNNSQKRAPKTIQLSALAIIALLLTTQCANATEVIKKFEVNARILKDSPKLDVNESIIIDFGKQPRHGLVRLYNPDQQITIISTVDHKGTGYATLVNQRDGKTQLRVGSPGTTITGSHTYNIHYTVDGAITRDGTLQWSPTGHNWQQKIEKFHLRLETPENQSSGKAQSVPVSYDGSYHINAKNGGIFQVQKSNIAPGQGIDLVGELDASYKLMSQTWGVSALGSDTKSLSNQPSQAQQVVVGLILFCTLSVWFAFRALQKATRGPSSGWSYGNDSYNSYTSSCSSATTSSCSSSSSSCGSSSSCSSGSSCGGGGSW